MCRPDPPRLRGSWTGCGRRWITSAPPGELRGQTLWSGADAPATVGRAQRGHGAKPSGPEGACTGRTEIGRTEGSFGRSRCPAPAVALGPPIGRYHPRGMVFSSVTFLFFFLPATIVLYYVVPRPAKNLLLLLVSLLFYTWGTGALVIALSASIAANYVLGLWIERSAEQGRDRRARAVLAVAVVMNVGLLAWFKYANFA